MFRVKKKGESAINFWKAPKPIQITFKDTQEYFNWLVQAESISLALIKRKNDEYETSFFSFFVEGGVPILVLSSDPLRSSFKPRSAIVKPDAEIVFSDKRRPIVEEARVVPIFEVKSLITRNEERRLL